MRVNAKQITNITLLWAPWIPCFRETFTIVNICIHIEKHSDDDTRKRGIQKMVWKRLKQTDFALTNSHSIVHRADILPSWRNMCLQDLCVVVINCPLLRTLFECKYSGFVGLAAVCSTNDNDKGRTRLYIYGSFHINWTGKTLTIFDIGKFFVIISWSIIRYLKKNSYFLIFYFHIFFS